MSATSRSAGFLYWVMLICGFAVLAPCLLLPAWQDYHAALKARDEKRRSLAVWERKIAGQARELEHLQNDPAYVERLARSELGLEAPGVTTLVIDAPGGPNTPSPERAAESATGEFTPDGSAAASDAAPLATDQFPRLTRWFEAGVERFPRALGLLMSPQARLLLGGLAIGLIVAAVVLLGSVRARSPAMHADPVSRRVIVSD